MGAGPFKSVVWNGGPLSGNVTAVLRRTLDVDREELMRTVLVSAYLFLVIAAYVILKAVRDSLYLDAFGAVKLPYVIVGIAVLVGLFVDGYIRASRRVQVHRLTVLTLAFLIANLVFFWVLGQTGQPWLYPVLYIWVGCFGVIAPVQVWTMVNEVFATRQVKRLLGFIGAGGIAGAVSGGALTGVLAGRMGTIHLLLVVVMILVVCVGLVAALAPYRRQTGPAHAARHPHNLRQAARTILASRHLRVIGGLVWISGLCTTLVDYQFKASVSGAGFDRDQLTAFFGTAYGAFALGCLATQLLLLRPLLRKIGLGVVILVLPLSLIAGSGVLLALGGLWAATLVKAADGVFKHSVDRSSKELAYLPVPANIKVSVKSTIDMVLDRFGDGSGGLLLMVLATWFGLGIRPIAAVNLLLLVGWLALALALRRSYLAELEQSIGHSGRLIASEHPLDDADAREALGRALRSSDDQEVLAALDLVGLLTGDDLDDELRRLTREGSPEVRARVFTVLLESEGPGLPDELTSRLESEDQDLLVKALDFVLAADAQEVQQRAHELIGTAAPETRGAMLALLVRRLGPEFEPMAERMLESLLALSSPASVRRAAATALGLLPPESSLIAPLSGLLEDRDAGVRRHAAESAGRLRRVDLAPQLVGMLGAPRTRRAARTALLSFRTAAGPALFDALVAEGTPSNVRRRTPRLLAQVAPPETLARVVTALASDRIEVRHAALATLSWRRRMLPGKSLSSLSRTESTAGLTREIASSRQLLEGWEGIGGIRDGADLRCLRTVLHERLLGGVERVFQWLELTGPPQQIRTIRAGLRIGDRVRRENAIELLEGLLSRELKGRVISLLDRLPWDGAAATGHRAPAKIDDVLSALAGGSDSWMAAWALNVARRRGLEEPLRDPPTSGRSRDAILDEELARSREAGEGRREERDMATTMIDKVMVLKAIDLFQAVPAEELVHLARVVSERSFSRGEALFSEGDSPGPLFIPLDGRVALQRGGVPAGEVPAGSPIGTWALFDEQQRTHGAVALEDLQALVVDREDFYDVLAENVEILRSLVGNLLHRLQGLTI